VPRLGLSASLVEAGDVEKHQFAAIGPSHADSGRDPHLPSSGLGEVAIGDRITVTAADGSSSVYRVTGRKVVDPHLAETEPSTMQSDPTLVTCLPLDPLLSSSLRLVIQATKIAPRSPPARRPEQKL
jgi:sortase (surface protein transpeptidase)